ncbi:hypothetical protein OOZ19_03015 [Saccharopolyspora sp. NFXS83]|uniref:hypothetical protein n=1 Tax=Saccharopolyspora sp. NFXS83 TaxID=2993560 RepID=UPI00224A4AA8|nr:hypothetical protein [Saccharopolyspora sp. NFXS83]MCX2729199.1 hypothetical protein [Saccharopolyspora sp. NFXS83]
MSEDLIEVVSPQLSAPVSRRSPDSGAGEADGVDPSIITIGDFPLGFAPDDE